MKKKASDTKKTQQPSYIDELLKNGTVILTAKTADDLNDMIDNIPAEVRYGAGAVAKNHETGVFSIRLDLV